MHINGLEGFWSYAKSEFITHHGVGPAKFPLYLYEWQLRYNHRQADLFHLLLNLGLQLVPGPWQSPLADRGRVASPPCRRATAARPCRRPPSSHLPPDAPMPDTPAAGSAERPAVPVAAGDAVAPAPDPRAPSVGGRLGRLSGRATRLPWGMLLAEAFFTVAAILLALAADDWRQRREERELARVALGNFVRELRANRAELASVAAYHDTLHAAFGAAAARTASTRLASMREVHPGFRGVAPAMLLQSAWETAVATGALRHLDYRAVHALASVYAWQRKLERLNDQMLATVLSPAVVGSNDVNMAVRIGAPYFGDVTAIEHQLLRTYDQLLRELAPFVDDDVEPSTADTVAGGGDAAP